MNRDNKAERRLGKQWELAFCDLAQSYGLAYTEMQIGREGPATWKDKAGKVIPEIELLAPSAGYDPLRATAGIWIEQWLKEAGIPGIRYKDQGSRMPGASNVTSNYVVFDDALVDVLRKYGIVGAAGAGMLGRQQPPQDATANRRQALIEALKK